MKKNMAFLLLILFSLYGCGKDVNFVTVDNGIDDNIMKFDLVSFNVLDTISEEEFYKVKIKDLEKGKPTQNEKELASVCKQILKDKEFKNDEIYTVVEYTAQGYGATYHEIGYFNEDVIVKHRTMLEPQKLNF